MINDIIKVNSNFKVRVNDFISNNNMHIKSNLPTIKVDNDIDWEIDQTLSRTYQVYLHSLLIVKDLTKFSLVSETKYFTEALKIIEDWWFNNKNNSLAWNEHAVAERVINIIYFQENSDKKIQKEIYEELLISHLNYLFDSNNYKENNHGLMMDRSLLVGGYYINNEIFQERAVDRFKNFIYKDFSNYGVHLENSPEYHSLALKIANEIIDIMKLIGIRISQEMKLRLKKADKYIPILSRPDKYIPMLGDSGERKFNGNKIYNNFCDHVSGTFLYQDYQTKSWLLLLNGYQNITHKHKDDMSIQFSLGNANIFVDSGKYNYDTSSKIRKYLISDKAHSKPYILERRYKIDSKDRFQTNIILDAEEFFHIEASHYKKNDFHIIRNVIFHKASKSLYIIDRFSSKEELSFISNFVFSPDLDIKLLNNSLTLNDISYEFKFSNQKMNLISKNAELFNWYSTSFEKAEKINRIFCRSKGKEKIHITYLNPKNLEKNVKVLEGHIKLEIENHIYTININDLKRW